MREVPRKKEGKKGSRPRACGGEEGGWEKRLGVERGGLLLWNMKASPHLPNT